MTEAFIMGIDAALVVSFILLLLAGAMSWFRGRTKRFFLMEDLPEIQEIPGSLSDLRLNPLPM